MEYELPQTLLERRQTLREFFDSEIRPLAEGRDSDGPFTKAELSSLISRLEPTGIMLAAIPREYGGDGSTFLERVIIAEEFVRAWPSLAVTVDSHNIVVDVVARKADHDMREKYLPKGISGESIFGDMMSEPESGSDTRNLQTTAVLKDGEYVVNGTKMWTTNGVWADVALLSAVVDADAYRRDPTVGVVHLLLDSTQSTWDVSDLPIIGLRSGTTGLSQFVDTRVPASQLLHDETDGYSQNLAARGWARVLLAAWATGLMGAAVEDAVEFAKSRVTFGKPIAGHQLIQGMLADMQVDLATSRLATYHAARCMDAGMRADTEQAIAKLHACEAVQRVTANAIQILGGRGLTTNEGYRTEQYYRDARFLTIAEGTSEIMRLILGRKMTGVSAFA
jgi:acyl-CoA dehydrogenase